MDGPETTGTYGVPAWAEELCWGPLLTDEGSAKVLFASIASLFLLARAMASSGKENGLDMTSRTEEKTK